MAFPVNQINRGSIQDKINSNIKSKALNKLSSNSNTISSTNDIENEQSSGVKLEISNESKLKSEELQNKKLIDNKESATDLLNKIKQQSGSITKAQGNSTPQNVLNLLA